MEPNHKMQVFKSQTQEKIRKLIAEFAEGTVSREQFHIIYERYTSQLAMADMAATSRSPDAVMGMLSDMPATVAVREAHMGKAVGMTIYNNRSGILMETLGDFDVSPEKLSPILNDFSMMMQSGKSVDRETRKISAKQWLVFAGGLYTTVVTLFRNEPSEAQCREIERLHRDFEAANQAFFVTSKIDSTKLAYPFIVFVQRKVNG